MYGLNRALSLYLYAFAFFTTHATPEMEPVDVEAVNHCAKRDAPTSTALVKVNNAAFPSVFIYASERAPRTRYTYIYTRGNRK